MNRFKSPGGYNNRRGQNNPEIADIEEHLSIELSMLDKLGFLKSVKKLFRKRLKNILGRAPRNN